MFAATLPLKGFYLNAKTEMSFVGTGAVLDATSPSFSGVTGLRKSGVCFSTATRATRTARSPSCRCGSS